MSNPGEQIPGENQPPPSRLVFVFLALLLLAGGGMALWAAWRQGNSGPPRGASNATAPPSRGGQLPRGADADWLSEFTLTDQDGAPFGTDDLAGRVYVTSFFFASCPGPCRQENLCVRDLQEEFGPKGVVFVSITCDPDNDTPDVLREYAGLFNANHEHWKFLTGELNYIRRVGAEIFYLPVDKQSHSENMIVIDKWGKIRGRYHWNSPEEIAQMKLDLVDLLAETEPPAEERDEPTAADAKERTAEEELTTEDSEDSEE